MSIDERLSKVKEQYTALISEEQKLRADVDAYQAKINQRLLEIKKKTTSLDIEIAALIRSIT